MARSIRLTVDKLVPFSRDRRPTQSYPTCPPGAFLSTPIIPSAYTIDIDKEDGIFLKVLLDSTFAGEQPHVAFHVGTLYSELGQRSTVESATIEIAELLEAYAAALRRMAPRLPAPMESP
jgi:hypothetical protein